ITAGGRVITLKEYQEALKRYLPDDTTNMDKTELAALKKDLITQLIEETLMLQEADKFNIAVTDAELDAEVERIKAESGDERFMDGVMGRYGDFNAWKGEIRKKLVINRVIERLITPKILVSEGAAVRYYEEHIKDYTLPEQARARMIVVATEEEARRVRGRLTTANFADVAREVSLSPERINGGDMGFFGEGDMPEEFEEVVFKLKTGEISRVVKTGYGYHIFILVERKKGGRLKYQDVRDGIMARVEQDKTEAELSDWIAFLKESAKVSIREELL
ncbi:MAG: peptidyl-prolyl cis-trans isomerase, partial [Deltaproteobacteria bacterium]|nr:peptidyl-prolyl cis-trans isomerase [Deltaproteobacteria bacterium]